MNLENIIVGVAVGMIYAFLGYTGQDKPFDWKRFLRTFALTALSALGLDVSGIHVDVYSAAMTPTAIAVLVQKLIDTAKK